MYKALIISLVYAISFFSLSYAQISVKNDPFHTMCRIGKNIEYLEDPTTLLSLERILAPEYQRKFVKIGQDVFNRPATNSVFWFKITVQKESTQDLWLEIGEENFTWYADFYAPDQHGHYGKPRLLGALRPQRNKEFPARSYCVLLFEKEEQGTRTFYLRLEEYFAFTHIFQVGTSFALFKYRKRQDDMVSWFIGLIAGVIIYNLFIFYSTREQLYIYYILHLFIVIFGIPFHNGYPWIHAAWVWEYFLIWNIPTSVLMTLFVLKYFEMQIHQHKYFVYWIWFLTIFQSLICPLGNIFLSEAFPDLINICSLVAILHSLSLFFLGLVIWFKGHKSARYYVFAWFLVILAIITFLLSVNGLMPINYFTRNALYFGFSAEALLFALALGDRLNILKREKEFAQKENLKILNQQNKYLEDRVLERTKKLQSANEEMQTINEELRQTQEELEAQKDFLDNYNQQLERANRKNQDNLKILHKQNKKLNFQNKKINSSMKAAVTIQQAILPQELKFQEFFQNNFVINRPRDVVSGDFYWLRQAKNKTLLVIADCTGHGVPGAFMTLIGVNLLDKITETLLIDQPADILHCLHKEIQALLNQQETENNNGMDAVVITLEDYKGQKLLTFAGAKNSIYYFSEGQLHELKGTRKSIGGIQNDSIQFEEQKVTISCGDMIYLGSDGLEDQNNRMRKKFGKKRLKQLLSEVAQLPITEQKLNIEKSLNNHMREVEQRDDILWMGIRL